MKMPSGRTRGKWNEDIEMKIRTYCSKVVDGRSDMITKYWSETLKKT
jgi:hypothetical protein